MLWELMVTDGHVRAARLRRLQPWIIALGILLLWLGVVIVRLGPDLGQGASASMKLQERLMKLQQHAETSFQKIPPPALSPEALKALPPAKEVAEVIAAITKALQASGDLPDGDIKFKEIDEETFWKGDWGTEQVNYLRDGNNLLVAANVSTGAPNYPQAARWIGLFHRGETAKGDKQWAYASLAAGNVFAPRELPYVSPQQVALSVQSFLPEPPPPPKKAGSQE
jgi:hypothetical protein